VLGNHDRDIPEQVFAVGAIKFQTIVIDYVQLVPIFLQQTANSLAYLKRSCIRFPQSPDFVIGSSEPVGGVFGKNICCSVVVLCLSSLVFFCILPELFYGVKVVQLEYSSCVVFVAVEDRDVFCSVFVRQD
jgi:hypothetical protein